MEKTTPHHEKGCNILYLLENDIEFSDDAVKLSAIDWGLRGLSYVEFTFV